MALPTVVLIATLLASGCTGAVGYRVSAGPVVDSNGHVALTARIGGHLGAFHSMPRGTSTSAGLVVPVEAFAGSNAELGGAYGIDVVRLGKLAGRLGVRAGFFGKPDDETRIELSLVSAVGRRILHRRGEYVLGGELRLSRVFGINQGEEAGPSRFSFGVVLGRYRYRTFDVLGSRGK